MTVRTKSRLLPRLGAVVGAAAVLALAAPMAANAAAEPRHSQTVIFNDTVKKFDGHRIHAFSCPKETPYLRNSRFDNGVVGRNSLIRGIQVEGSSEVSVAINWGVETDGTGRVTGWGEHVFNSLHNQSGVTDHWIRITAHCTSEVNEGYVR